MIVVYPFHRGDLPLALANLTLIQELGGVPEFRCILVTDERTPYAEMQRLAATAFGAVETHVVPNVSDGWPWAPNTLFEQASLYMATRHAAEPFLFLEADTTVTRPTWLREIAAAYQAHGTAFLGAVRDTFGADPQGRRIVVGKHMVGMGVYRANFFFQSNIVHFLHTSPALGLSARGFDIQLGDEILLAGCTDSPLFSHAWRTGNYRMEGGRIACDRTEPNANFDEPDLRIPALIHGCKDTSLIALVRQTALANIVGGFMRQPAEQDFIPHPEDGHTAVLPAVDPEYAEFLAWKAQRQNTFTSQVRPAIGGLPSAVFLPEAEAVRRSEQMQAVLAGMPVVRPEPYAPISAESLAHAQPAVAVPHEPTTQAELDAARAAVGGFPDDLDSPFGADLPAAALTAPEPPMVVADVPVARESEASVASGTHVVSEDRLPSVFASPGVAEIVGGTISTPSIDANIAEVLAVSSMVQSDAEKAEAIKADIRAGMAHKLLMTTHRVNAVTLKTLKAEVAAELAGV